MLDILTTSDEIEHLPNGSLALFKDTNDSLCLVLKEKYLINIADTKLFYYCINNTHNIIVKIFNAIYTVSLEVTKYNSNLFKHLKRNKSINIFLFSNNQENHSIHNTIFNSLRSTRNFPSINNKEELWNYIQKKRKLF